MQLLIEQWRAWAPGLEDAHAWQAWAQSPRLLDDDGAQPDCAFLSAMQRRRLSRLARMTMQVAWPLCGENEQLPFVFASRHGETSRTYTLLSDVSEQQPLSPTQFSLSVHNAIAGQWSILRGQRGESIALAGEADTFEHAMLEAGSLLVDGAPSVLVVIAEERPPEPYREWIADVPFSYALALRIGGMPTTPHASSGQGWQLRLTPSGPATAPAAWPHALDLLRAQLSGMASVEHSWKTRRWLWQRIP